MPGREWTTVVAGLPCSIEIVENGSWMVTMASTTRSRRPVLAAAIVDASEGLVGEQEGTAVAASAEVRLGYAAALAKLRGEGAPSAADSPERGEAGGLQHGDVQHPERMVLTGSRNTNKGR